MAFDLDEDELRATRKMNKADRNEIEVGEYVRTKDGKIGIFDRHSLRKENSLYKSPFNCFIKIRNRKTQQTTNRFDRSWRYSKNKDRII